MVGFRFEATSFPARRFDSTELGIKIFTSTWTVCSLRWQRLAYSTTCTSRATSDYTVDIFNGITARFCAVHSGFAIDMSMASLVMGIGALLAPMRTS